MRHTRLLVVVVATLAMSCTHAPPAPAHAAPPPHAVARPPALPPPGPRERMPACDPANPCPNGRGAGEACGRVSAGCPGVYTACTCRPGLSCEAGTCRAKAGDLHQVQTPPPPPPGPSCLAFDRVAYEQANAKAARLRRELRAKYQAVMARYHRNDGPEARAILDPLREEIAGRVTIARRLLGMDRPRIANPRAVFVRLGIATRRFGVPDHASLMAYVNRRVADGTLTIGCRAALLYVLGERTAHVTNPSSRGAPYIAEATAQTLRLFGIDWPKR